MNSMSPKKVMNGDRSVSHQPSEGKQDPTHLEGSFGSLQSPFLIFYCIVRVVSLISFQRHQQPCYRSFGVFLRFFSFFAFLSLSLSLLLPFFFIVNYVNSFLILKKVVNNIYYFRVTNNTFDSLNYIILLNILYAILFY